jgi:hypothetical protein
MGQKIHLSLITPLTDSTRVEALLSEWGRGERHLLVLAEFDSSPVVEQLLRSASTISTALGIRGLADVSAILAKHVLPGSSVFPFENDEQSIAELGEKLLQANINMIEVCADRICLPPSINPTCEIIEAQTERFAKLEVFDSTNITTSLLLPEGSSNANIVNLFSDRKQYEFARLRKRVLVNGIHFFFGLASRAYLRGVAPYDPSVAQTVSDARASQLFVRASEVRDKVDLCNRLFLLQLLVDAENSKIIDSRAACETLQRDLYKQQAIVTDRLQTMPDSLSRILNPSDNNFLKKGRSFLQNLRSLPLNLEKSEIVRAGISALDMERIEREVVEVTSLYLDELLGR